MKKLLWFLFLLLLILLGFLYILKNPSLALSQQILTTLWINMSGSTASTGVDLTNCESYFDGCNTCTVVSGQVQACTEMYCETPAEPQCLQYTWTWIDLSGCVSYFDGCNNCSVKDGRPDACTLMYCETPSQPKCNAYGTGWSNETWAIIDTWTTSSEWTDVVTGNELSSPSSPGSEWTACSMIYTPVCASVQVECIKAPCPPVEQTFSNTCVMNQNKLATFLHDGECTTK